MVIIYKKIDRRKRDEIVNELKKKGFICMETKEFIECWKEVNEIEIFRYIFEFY